MPTSNERLTKPSYENALKYTHRLYRLYPDSTKTEELTAAIVELIMRYPCGALERLFDPRNGIQCQHTFMPKCAELTKFLSPIEGQLYIEHEQKRRREQQMLPEPPRKDRPTYAELKAKYSPPGTHWGLQTTRDSVPKKEKELARIEDMKLSEEAKALVFDHGDAID